MTYSVHDEPDFARVYDEDDVLQVRRGDLRALLDLATGSMDFSSGFWCNEETEIARGIAAVLGIDPDVVTPTSFKCQYRGHHEWEDRTAQIREQERSTRDWKAQHRPGDSSITPPNLEVWFCPVCHTWAEEPKTF